MSLQFGRWVVVCLSLVVIGGLLIAPAHGQELKRRARLGIKVAPVEESDRSRLGLGAGEGALVKHVVPGSVAERLGFRANDVIVSVNGAAVAGVPQFLGMLRGLFEGDRFAAVVLREGKRVPVEGTLTALYDTSDEFDVLYRSVQTDTGQRRVIVTKPKGSARVPAVLFVGGIGCYSIDDPIKKDDTYRQMAAFLTRNGFATMRVEKSGIGDSEGAPCPQVDFETELDGYEAGLRALQKYEFVDPANVFIFGHSIGGIAGPVVANRVGGVKGVIAAETVGISWFEYELENLRRQLLLGGMDVDAVEELVSVKRECMRRLFFQGQSPEQIVADVPQCSQFSQYPAHYTYLRQIGNWNLPKEWKNLDAYVLAIYGGADFVTSADEHEYIVGVVNRYRPDHATFALIPDLDHFFNRHASQAESLRATQQPGSPAEFNPRINEVILDWLETTVKRPAPKAG